MAAAGVQPELQEPGVEPGPARGEAHVAHEREVHARADRGAVDRRDRRQRRPGDAEEALVDAAQARRRCEPPRCDRSAPAQNAGGAPVTTTAPTSVVGLERVQRLDDLVDHRQVERVAALGVVRG